VREEEGEREGGTGRRGGGREERGRERGRERREGGWEREGGRREGGVGGECEWDEYTINHEIAKLLEASHLC
jgi:hypothetical protein